MKNAIKTIVFCGLVFGLWCLVGIVLGFLLRFSSRFLDVSNFWGAVIFIAVISPFVDGVVYYLTMLLSTFLLSSKNSAIVGLLFTVGYCIYAIISYAALGGFFLGFLAFIVSVSFVYPTVVIYIAQKDSEEERKQEEREQLKREILEEMQNNQ